MTEGFDAHVKWQSAHSKRQTKRLGHSSNSQILVRLADAQAPTVFRDAP